MVGPGSLTTVVLAAEEGANPLLPATYDIVWSLVVFAVLFVLFWRYVLPTYLKTLDARTAAIQGGIERAERAQAEAAELRQQYEAQLAASRQEAGRTREQARAEGAAIIAAMRSDAQTEAARIVESAQRQIEAERMQAMTQLRREVGRLSVTLAERIVGEVLTDDERQQRVVDRFLADLDDASPDGAISDPAAADPAGDRAPASGDDLATATAAPAATGTGSTRSGASRARSPRSRKAD